MSVLLRKRCRAVKLKPTRAVIGGLVAAAFGAFKVETIGVLGGEIRKEENLETFLAEIAFPYQIAKRKPAKAYHNSSEKARLEYLLDVIGSFHSHLLTKTTKNGKHTYSPGYMHLSPTDQRHFKKEYPKGIQVITGLKPAEEIKPIKNGLFVVSGSLEYRGNVYRVSICAYYLNENLEERKAILDFSKRDLLCYLE